MRKRWRASVGGSPVVDVWKRQLGELSGRKFAHRFAASENLVLRLDILRKLDEHRGCVNTVSFNAAGDILVSGSDDRMVILWDWEIGQVRLSFHSGHQNNVFQAKVMPYSEDRSIVTCAADGQVRHAQILEGGKVVTKLRAKHLGRAHKLAIEPGSPHIFYTCGEDGLVQHIDLRTEPATGLFTCKPVQRQSYLSTVHLNAITIDPRNPNLFAVGGSDQFARLFDIRKHNCGGLSKFDRPVDFFCPPHLIGDEDVGITGLAFSDQSELFVSYNEEFIYLFTRDSGLGPHPNFTSQAFDDSSDEGDMVPDNCSGLSPSKIDDNSRAAPQAYKGHRNCDTVKGVNFFGPKCEYVVSGSDCGRIFIWKKKGGELVRAMEADKHIVNCIECHPHSAVLASSGIEHDIKMWIPKAIDRATVPTNSQKDKVPNLIHPRFGFFPFGGFYDDEDDFLDTEVDEDDDDEDGDDDDDDDDGEDGGDCNNNDSSTENDDDCSSDEVLIEEQLEEEGDDHGDDQTYSILLDDTEGNNEISCEDFYNEIEDGSGGDMGNDGAAQNAATDGSLVDICDIDDYSELRSGGGGGGDNDFDDCDSGG